MITIGDHGSSQLIRPEDAASGLVMAQTAEEPETEGDRDLQRSRMWNVEPGAEDCYMPP